MFISYFRHLTARRSAATGVQVSASIRLTVERGMTRCVLPVQLSASLTGHPPERVVYSSLSRVSMGLSGVRWGFDDAHVVQPKVLSVKPERDRPISEG
jgi:hypothetical protein